MTRSRPLTRLVPAALLVSVALMACNHQGTPPAERGNALVLGPVQSPYFDALRPSLNLVQYTGSQNVNDYDVLVFDGDAQSPQALQADPLVDQAMRAGKWVLGLDVTEDHKQTGFGGRLGAVNRGTSPGWMVRVDSDANGHPEVWMVDAPTPQAPSTSPLPPRIAGDATDLLNASTSAYARTVMTRLRAPLTEVGDTPIPPPGLIAATYHYTKSKNYPFKGTYQGSGTQTTNAQYDYVFHVYLDNSGNPQGDFQWVVVEAEVDGNPTSGDKVNFPFANMGFSEKAWFLDKQTVSIKPSADSDSLLTSFSNGTPATANNVTTVTSGETFTVTYNAAQGPGASFTYNNTVSKPLADWKVSNESSGNAFAWNYRSNYPLDADSEASYSCTAGFSSCPPAFRKEYSLILPNQPNGIATSSLALHTEAVWKTNSVLTQQVTFELGGSQGLADLYGEVKDGAPHGDHLRYDVDYTDTFTIDMSTTLPIPLTLSFDSLSVKAGSAVTGTITLDSPAFYDTVIQLQSTDTVHAPVDSTVTVPRNQKTASFVIHTDPSGAAPGSVFKPTIRAFYGKFTDVQLTITN